MVNRAPIVLFQQWNDGISVKAFFLYEEAEEGHIQVQLPGILNKVREQGWQGEVLPRNQKLAFSVWQNVSIRILEEVEPRGAKAICEEKLNTSRI